MSYVIPKNITKFKSEVKPLGSLDNKRESNFVVGVRKRRVRTSKQDFEPYEVPTLAGQPDTELISLLNDRPGIVTNLVDEGNDEDNTDTDNVVTVEHFY